MQWFDGAAVIALFLLAALGWRLPLHVVLMPHHVIHHHLLHPGVPFHHVLALTLLLRGQVRVVVPAHRVASTHHVVATHHVILPIIPGPHMPFIMLIPCCIVSQCS